MAGRSDTGWLAAPLVALGLRPPPLPARRKAKPRPPDPFKPIIPRLDIDVVVDVGANAGQYGAYLRKIGFTGEIISFEPLAVAFARLEARAAGDGRWAVHRLALGERDETRTINVAGNSVSSSFRSATPAAVASEPRIAAVGTETTTVETLDRHLAPFLAARRRIMVKLDVQGFEREVLAGGAATLPGCAAMQVEMAVERSYEGQATISELIDTIDRLGFRLVSLKPGFGDRATGYLYEVDGLFVSRRAGL